MRKILILDDEQTVRQSFVDYFEDRLWLPIQAESAEQALALLEQESVAAAIVDMRLPGMDGNSFIREACRRGHSMAFLICTGSPEYCVPDDLLARPCVSKQLFRKPVNDIEALERELIRVIETIHLG